MRARVRVVDEHPFCSGEKLSNCKAAASLTRRMAREIDSESCGIETAGFLRASAKSSCASLLEMHGDAWRCVEMQGDPRVCMEYMCTRCAWRGGAGCRARPARTAA